VFRPGRIEDMPLRLPFLTPETLFAEQKQCKVYVHKLPVNFHHTILSPSKAAESGSTSRWAGQICARPLFPNVATLGFFEVTCLFKITFHPLRFEL
jgi:hypothetical protein